MTDLVLGAAQALRSELHSLDFAHREFPMLATWGVEDFSHTIHSLGCNYLSAFGREQGFWAISDYPVRVQDNGKSVRPDVAWWEKKHAGAVLLGEFERLGQCTTSKLVEKAQNLLQAHHSLGPRARILLLLGWTLAGTDVIAPEAVSAVIHEGFRIRNAEPVPGLDADSVFILGTAVFGEVGGARRLIEVRL